MMSHTQGAKTMTQAQQAAISKIKSDPQSAKFTLLAEGEEAGKYRMDFSGNVSGKDVRFAVFVDADGKLGRHVY
jgi:hypothetical protein